MPLLNNKIGIFTLHTHTPLYIDNDRILAVMSNNSTKDFVTISNLSAWLKAFAKKIPTELTMPGNSELQARIKLTYFCICRLIPYLKFLDSEDTADLECPTDLELELESIRKRAASMVKPERIETTQLLTIEDLQDIFCVPCEITNAQVIPLQPVSSSSTKDNDVFISGLRLRRRRRLVRPLNRVIAEVEIAIKTGAYADPVTKIFNNNSKSVVLKDLDKLIKRRFKPARMTRYELVYKDRYHQLLYKNGHFVLARGPLHSRTNRSRTCYVGLPISGTTREQLLAVRPRCTRSLNDLWTLHGTPNTSGMCIGSRNQYRRLNSDFFIDEEAVVQFLDAGVIIATGISALHNHILRLGMDPIRPRPVPLVRSRIRR